MASEERIAHLALHGGPKVRQAPWPGRQTVGTEEKQAAEKLFDQAIDSGNPFGYNGPEETAYCEEFSKFMGGGFADAVNSGTNAIYIGLKALGVEPFTEVIVGAVTDPGGMMPIPLLNCIPVVADTVPDSFNPSAEQIEPLISPLTSAIVVAHIAGEPADIEGVIALANKHNIPVLEDCAQAHGSKLNGKYVGTFGDVGAFSTMFGKHHFSGGQGGIVYTKREDLYWPIRRSADRGKPFGLQAGSTNCIGSLNLNMDELSAAIGRAQLKKLPQVIEKRTKIVHALGKGIEQLKSLEMPVIISGGEPNYWFLRVKVHHDLLSCDKKTFCQALSAEGLPVSESYRGALPHTMEWFKTKRVFGTSQHPWSSPDYKGDPNREFPCPNTMKAMEDFFILHFREGWQEQEIKDALTIMEKVENAYLKQGN